MVADISKLMNLANKFEKYAQQNQPNTENQLESINALEKLCNICDSVNNELLQMKQELSSSTVSSQRSRAIDTRIWQIKMQIWSVIDELKKTGIPV